MILIPATTPNSFNISLRVKANTAKPMAAARLQNKCHDSHAPDHGHQGLFFVTGFIIGCMKFI